MFPMRSVIGPLRFLAGPRSWVGVAKVREALFGSGNVHWTFRYFSQMRYNALALPRGRRVLQVNFELLFEPVNRQWKIFGVSVNLTAGGPAAPDTPAVDKPKPSEASPPPEAPSVTVGKKTTKR